MKRVFPRIFLPLVCLLYACFLVLDLTALADSTWIKYVSILLCFSAALLNHSCQDGRLVVLALLFTAAADWFLLVQNRNYLFGVSLFCIVQFIYSIRLYRLRGRLCFASLPFRILPLSAFFFGIDTLSALSVFYFSNLAVNAWEGVLLRSCGRKHRLFACGLLLFVGCDLCVGAWNLGIFPSCTHFGMWLFYLPSQVCIALSSYPQGATKQ